MHQLVVYRQYQDAGLSGKSIKGRPQLERLLEDVKAGKIDTVIVWRLNRLSRSLTDILEMVELFTQHGVSLRSLTEQLNTGSAHGILVLQMLGATAEFERGQISSNVRSSMLERSRQGNWNAGNNVLGYRWVRNESTSIHSVEILEDEAEIVRSIFNMYATGQYGLKAISNHLNSKGFLTKKGMPFGIHSIRYILQNPNYIGMVRYSVNEDLSNRHKMTKQWSKGDHLPIIDKALWDQVHSIYATRSKQPLRIIKRQHLLTGLLKCPQCGKSMVP